MTVFLQILLGTVIIVLTFLVAFAGFQVFHLLHELKLALKKINQILDHTHTLSASAAKPITAVNEFFTEVKDLVGHTEDEIINSLPDRVHKPRLFHRSGLPLRPS